MLDEPAGMVPAVKVVACLAIIAFSLGGGVWLALWDMRKRGRIPQGESAIGHFRAGMRRDRSARRELLTPWERAVAWTMLLLSVVFPPAGVIILLTAGGSSLRVVGIAMLVLALVVMAVPTSPILQARVRRRQRASRGP